MPQKEEPIRAVERAFAILRTFARDDDRLTLSEIASRVGLPITTCLRFAITLEGLGVLVRREDKTWSLGSELYVLGCAAHASLTPQNAILPYMKQIREETKEAVTLYGISGEQRVCLEHLESMLFMQCRMNVGDRLPLWAGASGRALLAFMGSEAIARETAKIERLTASTITDPKEFAASLAAIRADGYALSTGEREEGVLSIAIPIFDRRDEIKFTFSVAGPDSRFTRERAEEIVPQIQEMCREISQII